MVIYPAIDLRGGRVVRLRQGRASEQIIYSDDPASVAARWEREGAAWLHVVDLDRALGDPAEPNARALAAIRAAVQLPIQFGGGLRDAESVARAFQLGMNRVVIGTMAVENPSLFAQIVERWGSEQIVVALDVHAGRVAVRGWREVSDLDAADLGKQLFQKGIRRALVTDIARDGMLSGVDAGALARLAHETGLRVIASGGIATLDDLRSLARHEPEGLEGAIVGQALYTGAFTLREAVDLTRLPPPPLPSPALGSGEGRAPVPDRTEGRGQGVRGEAC